MCDLNRASIDEIAAFDGIGADVARKLNLWRPYGGWGDLDRVPGLGPGLAARLKRAGATLSKVDLPDWRPPAKPFHW